MLLLISTLYTRQAAEKARQAMEVYQQENKALLAAQTSLRQQNHFLLDLYPYQVCAHCRRV